MLVVELQVSGTQVKTEKQRRIFYWHGRDFPVSTLFFFAIIKNDPLIL